MRTLIAAIAMALVAVPVFAAQQTPTSKAAAHKPAAHKTAAHKVTAHKAVHRSPAHKTTRTKSTTKKSSKTPARRRTRRVRNVAQQQPTAERYKEIQQALADKGFFKGQADGDWGPESVDALKRFQREQKIADDGKIGSLALIALGLGPRRGVTQGVRQDVQQPQSPAADSSSSPQASQALPQPAQP